MDEKELHTAVCYREDLGCDLEEPLISRSSSETSVEIDMDIARIHETQRKLSARFRCLGFGLSALLQIISLGSTAVLATKWNPNSTTDTLCDKICYASLFALSHSWLIVFPAVCVAVDRLWRSRLDFDLHSRYFGNAEATRDSQRALFVVGVQFLVGVVLGCFAVWALTDIYLGSPAFMRYGLLEALAACLFMCYLMVVIYDCFSVSEEST